MATQTGYKASELGMIPQDWEIRRIGDFAPLQRGFDLPNSEIQSGDYPVVYSNGIGNYHNCYTVKSPCIATGRSGTLGKVHYVEQDCWVHNTSLWVTKFDNCEPKFIYFLFQKIGFERFASGSGVPTLNRNDAHEFKIALPKSITEQTAIATVLSDTDALISSLQTLIAKKQAIKLSAMQNLLSGKIRLPEFTQRPAGSSKTTRQTELGCVPEDWEIGTIGKDCVLIARIGWQSLRTDEYLESGEYGLITGTDFNNGLVDWKTCSFVSEWRYKQDTNIQLKVNDVLITKDGTIGKLGYINELPFSATLNSGIYVIRPKNSNLIEPMFLFYLFSSEYFNDFISVISAGSTITHLYQKDFVNFQFPLPSKTEQTAIAQLLSDMDAEIEALECRLKKTQSLKQGMMQALLTGKIRLPLE